MEVTLYIHASRAATRAFNGGCRTNVCDKHTVIAIVFRKSRRPACIEWQNATYYHLHSALHALTRDKQTQTRLTPFAGKSSHYATKALSIHKWFVPWCTTTSALRYAPAHCHESSRTIRCRWVAVTIDLYYRNRSGNTALCAQRCWDANNQK